MNTTSHSTKLTPLQLELLKVYAMELPEEKLIEIKDLLGNYFLQSLSNQATAAAEEKGYTKEDFDSWLNDPKQ
jgi:hypothetical protein